MATKTLKKWREVIDSLQNPSSRPNDFQRFVLSALASGMTARDATRVFGLSEGTIYNWRKQFSNEEYALSDFQFFVLRAHELGASDELIGKWFGIDRADRVAAILADARSKRDAD